MANLCTLGRAKAYLNIAPNLTQDDALLLEHIVARSADFMREINRVDFSPAQSFTEVREGDGGRYMALPHYPLNSITSVTVAGTPLAASTDRIVDGYFIQGDQDPERRWELFLARAALFTDLATVVVVYNAGYGDQEVENEPWNVPASPFQVQVAGALDFTQDVGVSYSGGAALTKVNGVPTVGQYAVDAQGVYTFAAADTGAAVVISYDTLGVPGDVAQAVVEWVAYTSKDRLMIGQTSRHMGAGETTTFQQLTVPLSTARVLEHYCRKFPPRCSKEKESGTPPPKQSLPNAVRHQDEFGL